MSNVNKDTMPRDRSGYGKGSKDKDQGPTPRKKSVSDNAMNGKYDKVNTRNK